jgi:nitrogen regulatory protein PII
MIVINGWGTLRNNQLELIRALEIVQIIALLRPLNQWRLRYGEVPVAGSRVDAVLIIGEDEKSIHCGIEIVADNKDIDKNRSKLMRLINLGEISEGYIYVRRIDEVQNDVVSRLRFLERVEP